MTDTCEGKINPVPIDKDNIVGLAEYLWQEYEYRHDLCWKLLFRLTGAVLVLLVIPYLYPTITLILDYKMLILSATCVALIFFGWYLIDKELALLDTIRERYRCLQNLLFPGMHDVSKKSNFKNRVIWYLRILGGVIVLNAIILVFVWIPQHNVKDDVKKLYSSWIEKELNKGTPVVEINLAAGFYTDYAKLLKKLGYKKEENKLTSEINNVSDSGSKNTKKDK